MSRQPARPRRPELGGGWSLIAVTPDPEAQPALDLDEVEPPARRYGTAVVAAIAVLALLFGAGAGYLLGRPTTPTDTSVDAGFARDMATHHAQGVDMAMTLARSPGPQDDVRQIATDIALTQQAQIGMMQAWLREWNLSPTPPGKRMAWMAAHHHDDPAQAASMALRPDGLMPGMATAAEIAKLRAATGTAKEILFLQLMIRHHRAGVQMAAAAAELAAQPEVRELASTMVQGQRYEIELLTQALRERGAAPLPAS